MTVLDIHLLLTNTWKIVNIVWTHPVSLDSTPSPLSTCPTSIRKDHWPCTSCIASILSHLLGSSCTPHLGMSLIFWHLVLSTETDPRIEFWALVSFMLAQAFGVCIYTQIHTYTHTYTHTHRKWYTLYSTYKKQSVSIGKDKKIIKIELQIIKITD